MCVYIHIIHTEYLALIYLRLSVKLRALLKKIFHKLAFRKILMIINRSKFKQI